MSAAHWTAIAFAALGAVFFYMAFRTYVVDVGFVGALVCEAAGGAFIATAAVIEIVWVIAKLAKRRSV